MKLIMKFILTTEKESTFYFPDRVHGVTINKPAFHLFFFFFSSKI